MNAVFLGAGGLNGSERGFDREGYCVLYFVCGSDRLEGNYKSLRLYYVVGFICDRHKMKKRCHEQVLT